MRRALRRLWRRAVHCRRGQHRETIECAFGVMRTRCVDCHSHQAIGWVYVGVSNRQRTPWRDDA